MGHSTSIHDIKTLILSFHPLIAIETTEEDRVIELLRTVADQLQLVFFEWSITRGLTASGNASPVAGTMEPLLVLKHLERLTVKGIFLLKDFARYGEDPKVARQFREVAQAFATTRSTLVLSGARLELPGEIEQLAVRYELQLPGREELLDVSMSVLRSLKGARRVDTHLLDEDREALLRALQGLTLNQARQAIAGAVLEDGKLSRDKIGAILKRKAQLIGEGGLLEYYPPQDNRFGNRGQIYFPPCLGLPGPRGTSLRPVRVAISSTN